MEMKIGMDKRLKIVLGCLFLFSVLSWWGFEAIIKPLVESILSGSASPIFTNIINAFYPRLSVEMRRFPPAFFIGKAAQVIIRLNLIVWFVALFWWLERQEWFRLKAKNWWYSPISVKKTGYAIRVLALLVAWFTYDNLPDLYQRTQMTNFYAPLLPLRLLHIPCYSPTAVTVVTSITFLACAVLAVGFINGFSAGIMVLGFIAWQAFMYSFEKFDHTFANLTSALLPMPFLAHLVHKAKQNGQLTLFRWPLQLMRIGVVLCYFYPGIEKLLIAGPSWASSQTFMSYLFLHPRQAGLWAAQYPFLMVLLPVTALLTQITFPLVLFWPRLTWFYIPLGLMFHAGLYIFMGVGGFFTPWITVYFLLPEVFGEKGNGENLTP